MASSSFHCLILFSSLIFNIAITPSLAKTSFKPKALVLPVAKDSSTLQYITTIKQRTPLVPIKLTIDLGGQSLWVNCDEGQYISSTCLPIATQPNANLLSPTLVPQSAILHLDQAATTTLVTSSPITRLLPRSPAAVNLVKMLCPSIPQMGPILLGLFPHPTSSSVVVTHLSWMA